MKLGVVTNGLAVEQREKLALCKLLDAVDFVLIPEEAGVKKPDPEIFHLAARRAGAPADEIVMVGDSWENDVAGALAAGLSAVWFNRYGNSAPGSGALAEIDSLKRPGPLEKLLLG